MHIKQTSPSLRRVNNESTFSIQYHKTVVLTFDKKTGKVTFRTDGWETMNTATAMSFGLTELGFDAHVEYRNNKKEQGLFLVTSSKREQIRHGSEVSVSSKLERALQ
jgi:hypothetical protein